MPTMNDDEARRVLDVVDSEGFDYAFRDYSDFKDIKDKEFHKLRIAYIEAAAALAAYIEVEQ